MIPDRSVPALRPPNVFSPGDDFTLWSFRARSYLKEVPAAQYGQYLLSLLDDSAARQLLSTGTSIEAPPAALWEILDDLFNVRQPTLLQLERFRERKQLPEVPAAQYGQYLLSLLDDSAARQLLSTGTSIEAPPAALWEILDDLFNVRQPTLLQLERFRERKQLPEVPAAQYGQYLLSLLDDSAARQLLSTGTSIEAPPAALWEILDDLFKVRQPTLLQLERFRERKQLPGVHGQPAQTPMLTSFYILQLSPLLVSALAHFIVISLTPTNRSPT
ncbi:hypothetical protein CRM22_005690 [Opisthorchis felineus]|uniref:Uncharacterized protein n=1 Tax=Opisthorchis felineus TaxID=147828 RepID=A0A4V3SET0_OPIFE|nr:hypothetical protein CRM22_005690 [Opisthorchis felineus]